MKKLAVLVIWVILLIGVAITGVTKDKDEGWYVWTGGHMTRTVEEANAIHEMASAAKWTGKAVEAAGWATLNPNLIATGENLYNYGDVVESGTSPTVYVPQVKTYVVHVRAGIERSGVHPDRDAIDFHRIMGTERYPGQAQKERMSFNMVGPGLYGVRPRPARGYFISEGGWNYGSWEGYGGYK